MKTIGVLGAIQEEVEQIMAALNEGKSEEVGGVVYHHGHRAGRRVVVCCAGMGKANAAAATQMLITQYGAQGILFSGVAGNMSSEIGIGDVVIGQEVFYHDASDELLALCPPYTALYTAHPLLVDVAKQACELTGVRYLVGRIATGDQFIGDTETKRRIQEKCHPDCVEMEGAAVAQIAMRNNVPFVVLRAMSDNCDEALSFDGADKFDISAYVTTASAIVVAAIDALKTLDTSI
ncbi:MAG: 5'-methylthioadenosine/adenosylhomocysteine nucleosidase [Ruminococcaceae bacterium]|nr:5'-methylthioadenosine/adenosylhomocysteine nucleosidase [Oscillospiraceae bacterium]